MRVFFLTGTAPTSIGWRLRCMWRWHDLAQRWRSAPWTCVQIMRGNSLLDVEVLDKRGMTSSSTSWYGHDLLHCCMQWSTWNRCHMHKRRKHLKSGWAKLPTHSLPFLFLLSFPSLLEMWSPLYTQRCANATNILYTQRRQMATLDAPKVLLQTNKTKLTLTVTLTLTDTVTVIFLRAFCRHQWKVV